MHEATIKELESLLEGDELKAAIDDIRNNSTSIELKTKLSEEVQKQLVRQDGKKTQSDDYLIESYNENARRGQHFEADLSQYDEKHRATIQKAIDSGILNMSLAEAAIFEYAFKLGMQIAIETLTE